MGVGVEGRVSNILEEKTGVEHMNFSVKNTGSLHHFLTYENLASQFEHDVIMVELYPYNDFIDADLDKKRIFDPKYSGYFLTGTYPNYEPEYYSGYQKPGQSMYVEAVLSEYTHSYHVLLYLKNRINKVETNPASASKYYEFSEEEFLKFVYPLEKLAKKAPDKKVYLISMPYINDIEAFRQNPNAPFIERLGEVAAKYDNVEHVDLLESMSKQTGDDYLNYYYPCNKEHYSSEGYALIADLIYAEIYEDQVSSRDD